MVPDGLRGRGTAAICVVGELPPEVLPVEEGERSR